MGTRSPGYRAAQRVVYWNGGSRNFLSSTRVVFPLEIKLSSAACGGRGGGGAEEACREAPWRLGYKSGAQVGTTVISPVQFSFLPLQCTAKETKRLITYTNGHSSKEH
eukprot:128756-Rhodomonas_salina.2